MSLFPDYFSTDFNEDKIKQATLHVVKFQLAQVISLREFRAIHGVVPDVMIDMAAQQLVMRLKMFLAQGHIEHTGGDHVVEYYADWRQSFKARWFDNRLLRWLLRRYPAKKTVVRLPKSVTITKVCPHLPITEEAARDGRAHYHFLVHGH